MDSRAVSVAAKTYKFCGVSPGTEEFEWLYFVKLGQETMDTGICVKKCPEPKMDSADLKDQAYGGQKLLDEIDFNTWNTEGTYKSNKFAPLRLCMPDPDDLAETHPL